MTEDCNCGGTTVPDTHPVSCPASLYQAGIQRGTAAERTRVVAQLRTWADAVEKGQRLAAAGADEWYIEVLRKAASALEHDENGPSWAK